MENITLIVMPGSGKSNLGALFAERLCQVRSMLATASVCRSQSVFTEFPSVTGLSSRASAVESDSALFGSFFGTTPMSDFSVAYTSGLWPQAFPDRSGNNLPETVAGTVADLDHQEDIAPHHLLEAIHCC